jgi:toxin-antitoxin system PIN domain toxin
VIVPDLNLLLYAVDDTSPQHAPARRWLSDMMSGTETVAFAWTVLLGFVRLATSARVFSDPLAVGDAIDVVSGWLAQPNAIAVDPTDRHLTVLRDLLDPLGTAGSLTTDGHLAALAIEHGAEIHSADTDFARFPGLRWTNPLAGD